MDSLQDAASSLCRERDQSELGERMAKFKRGPAVATRGIPDKKLKSKMRYSERLADEAAYTAAKAEKWLLPSEPGELEVESMERTWQIQQARHNKKSRPILCCRGG